MTCYAHLQHIFKNPLSLPEVICSDSHFKNDPYVFHIAPKTHWKAHILHWDAAHQVLWIRMGLFRGSGSALDLIHICEVWKLGGQRHSSWARPLSPESKTAMFLHVFGVQQRLGGCYMSKSPRFPSSITIWSALHTSPVSYGWPLCTRYCYKRPKTNKLIHHTLDMWQSKKL